VYDRARLEREHEIMRSLTACLRASSVFVLSMELIDFHRPCDFHVMCCGLSLGEQITCGRLLPTSPKLVPDYLFIESLMLWPQCAIERESTESIPSSHRRSISQMLVPDAAAYQKSQRAIERAGCQSHFLNGKRYLRSCYLMHQPTEKRSVPLRERGLRPVIPTVRGGSRSYTPD
jgi:hypothetical protein